MKYSHLKTLLVDDEEVVQMLVQRKLNSFGIECSLASTGTEAIEAVGKFHHYGYQHARAGWH